jgi:hypothetical protein
MTTKLLGCQRCRLWRTLHLLKTERAASFPYATSIYRQVQDSQIQ